MHPFFATSALFEAAFQEHERIFQSLRQRADAVWGDRTGDRRDRHYSSSTFQKVAKNERTLQPRQPIVSIAPISAKVSATSQGVKRQDTLAREGIKPSITNRPVTASSKKSTSKDFDRGHNCSSGSVSNSAAGWNEIAAANRGSIASSIVNRGSHSIIEATKDVCSFWIYEPRLRENKKACMSSPPLYTISAQLKLLPESHNLINLVVGYRDINDYFILHVDILQHTVSLFHCNDMVSTLQQLLGGATNAASTSFTSKHSLLVNRFYPYKVEVSGSVLTLSINGNTIFNYDADTFSGNRSCMRGFDGLPGLLCLKCNKLIFKDWRVSGSKFENNVEQAQNDDSNVATQKYSSDQLKQNLAGLKTPALQDRLKDLKYEKDIIEAICNDIVIGDVGVSFDDIAALEGAKGILNEAVVLPLIMPELFTGMREPWKGILLFGPPGTGKTMLAKAIASTNKCTFFNCSAGTLVSKWRGDSEKLVKCLFDSARACAPSIIFIDEIDGLVTSRGNEGEHEASRRMKTEILSQMDGLTAAMEEKNKRITVLATTNCPWALDAALLRRLEKRVYIPLPDFSGRCVHLQQIVKAFSQSSHSKVCISEKEIEEIALATEGFSGADIATICKEASMGPVRRLLANASIDELQQQRNNGTLEMSEIAMSDFEEAIHKTKSSVCKNVLEKYETWNAMHGST